MRRPNYTLLLERIRQLAIEQMYQGVRSIIFTRLADGSIEVSVMRELRDFGLPPCAIVDRATMQLRLCD